MAARQVRIGTAGWQIPVACRDFFMAEGSALERYASRFNAVEINSSFHRPHRRTTYERWAASVPTDFRFAVKLPKTISHERKLVDCGDLIARFAEESAGLGGKRGPLLLQLPPSLAFDEAIADSFLTTLAREIEGPIVCEPRHPSWFAADADALLVRHKIARVAADPARVPEAAEPGGDEALTYVRLHGSPAMYRSAYGDEGVARHAALVQERRGETWVMYDNTTLGAATADALALTALLAQPE